MTRHAPIFAALRAALGQPEAHLSRAIHLAGRGAALAAVRHIAAAAHAGLPDAQTQLGLCYLNGLGVPPSTAEARHWLDRAAEAGDPRAQTELAALALRGMSGDYHRGPFNPPEAAEPDHASAAILARRAAASGSAEAQALLAYILGMAPDMAETPGEADALYREASGAGWPLGQLGHAMVLLRAGETAAARVPLMAAAEAGLPTAGFLLGAIAEAASDLRVAVAHYSGAADRGHIGACTRLGLALLSGRGVTRDPEEAETWLRRAAVGGDVVAAAFLGDFHASPARDPPNLPEAARWYRHAAERGHGGSARALSRLIAVGVEGLPDARDIVSWLRTAVELGEAAAWPDLGALIVSAALPERDRPELYAWLERMTRAGEGPAWLYAGVCANGGFGTPIDEVLARRHYLHAASLGVIEAMVTAAEMLLNGRGGAADRGLALGLFAYAARHDHAGASFALGVLAGEDRAAADGHFRRAAALGHAGALGRVG